MSDERDGIDRALSHFHEAIRIIHDSGECLGDGGALEDCDEDCSEELAVHAAAVKRLAIERAEVERLRGALERIAAYDTDWTINPYANVTRLQAMAEAALATTPPTSEPRPPQVPRSAGIAPDVCYRCGGKDRHWAPCVPPTPVAAPSTATCGTCGGTNHVCETCGDPLDKCTCETFERMLCPSCNGLAIHPRTPVKDRP